MSPKGDRPVDARASGCLKFVREQPSGGPSSGPGTEPVVEDPQRLTQNRSGPEVPPLTSSDVKSPPRSHHLVMSAHHVLPYRPKQRRNARLNQDQGAQS